MIEAMPEYSRSGLELPELSQHALHARAGLCPVSGPRTLVTTKAWERLDVSDRKAIRASVEKAAERFRTEVPEQDAEATTEIKSVVSP